MRTQSIVELLLVEDNPGDARLLEEVLKEEGIAARLRVVRDGIEALNALRAPARGSPTLSSSTSISRARTGGSSSPI